MKPVRIIIADDHELARQGMRTILQSEPGWLVCCEARTGTQVVAQALELKPDVVVLGLLREMNGVEVIRQVRRVLPVPILIVMVDLSDQAVHDAIEAGANGYILKADAGRTLPKAVHTILSRGEFFSDSVGLGSGIRTVKGHAERVGRSKRLTSREDEVLRLLAQGLKHLEIASMLHISPKTAATHRARIMAKLEMHSITELVEYAVRNRIIEP